MLTKNDIKFFKSLEKKRERDLNHLFVAEGSKLVIDIIRCGGEVDEIFCTSSWISEQRDLISKHQLTPIIVSPSEMERITGLSSPSPVAAQFHQPDVSAPKITSDSILILDNLRDPGNMGTIIRTADWFGIKTIICSPETVDCFNPKVIQSTMGSIMRVNLHYTPLADFMEANKDLFTYYGTFMNGASIQSQTYAKRSAFIIGNEAHGISDSIAQLTNQRIAIPGNQAADGVQGPESLNAAVATSVVLFDWFSKQS